MGRKMTDHEAAVLMEATDPATTLLLNEARAVQAVPTEDTIWHLIGYAQLIHKRDPQDAATAVRLALGLFGELGEGVKIDFGPMPGNYHELNADRL
jgi:hypothetical protein